MSNYFQQIEAALLPLASEHTPESSEPQAVAHQWAHALAYGHPLYGAQHGITKRKLTGVLKKAGLYTDAAALQTKLPKTPVKPQKASTFTFIDLFAGIGGMRIGFQKAGGHCVFSSEFDKKAQATYCENHGDYPFGNITKIAAEDIPDHDVLVAGFPCQPFSHAGLNIGVEKLCCH